MTKLQQRCINRIEEVFQIAEKHYGRKFSRPEITFSNRLTKCAGKAIYTREESASSMACGVREVTDQKFSGKEIRLSNVILGLDPEKFIADTPGHEAAHIIAVEQYGFRGTGHGHYWKEVMSLINQQANTLHSMETKKARSFLYTGEKELTIIRHNKLQRGKVEWYEWRDGTRVYKDDFICEV